MWAYVFNLFDKSGKPFIGQSPNLLSELDLFLKRHLISLLFLVLIVLISNGIRGRFLRFLSLFLGAGRCFLGPAPHSDVIPKLLYSFFGHLLHVLCLLVYVTALNVVLLAVVPNELKIAEQFLIPPVLALRQMLPTRL